MMRSIHVFMILAASAALAGCSGGSDAPGGVFASEKEVYSKKAVVIEAGTTFSYAFSADGAASYEFALTDDSSVDIGFIQTQDIVEYRDGASVYTYGYHSEVSRAADNVALSGEYTFVIHCNNVFADCDGILEFLRVTS